MVFLKKYWVFLYTIVLMGLGSCACYLQLKHQERKKLYEFIDQQRMLNHGRLMDFFHKEKEIYVMKSERFPHIENFLIRQYIKRLDDVENRYVNSVDKELNGLLGWQTKRDINLPGKYIIIRMPNTIKLETERDSLYKALDEVCNFLDIKDLTDFKRYLIDMHTVSDSLQCYLAYQTICFFDKMNVQEAKMKLFRSLSSAYQKESDAYVIAPSLRDRSYYVGDTIWGDFNVGKRVLGNQFLVYEINSILVKGTEWEHTFSKSGINKLVVEVKHTNPFTGKVDKFSSLKSQNILVQK